MTKHSPPAARSRRLGRKGFTLVELSIVLVLVAILGTMTVSFTTLVSGYSGNNQKEYEFLEQCTRFKQTLTDWISDHDDTAHTFTIKKTTDNNAFTVAPGSTESNSYSVVFMSDFQSLHLGADTYAFSAIGSVSFSSNGQMIKCTLTSASNENLSKSFVFSLRCAKVEKEGDTQ